MANGWVCKGVAKDGVQYSNQSPSEAHEPYENFGRDCAICNLTKEQVQGSSRSGKSAVPLLGLSAGAIALFSLLVMGAGRMILSPSDPATAIPPVTSETEPQEPDTEVGEKEGDQVDQEQEGGSTNLQEELTPWAARRFTWGQQTLFPGTSNPLRDEGIEAFKAGDYQKAADHFKRAVEGNRNDPEVLIFMNNALSRLEGEPYTLAVVVPIDSREKSAQEMLRGVAQAQHWLNASGGVNGKFLEIVIANDGNDPENATRVAEEIVKDSSILGVIGHNSSSASKAGLAVYEGAGLPMISPTSTSTGLKGDVFFRTVPSDAAAAKKLAQHAWEEMGISNAIIYYNPRSAFSNSLKSAFEMRFSELGGTVVSEDMTAPNLNPGRSISSAESDYQAEAALLFPDTGYTSVAIELAQANSNLPADRQLKLLGSDSLYSIETLTAGGDSIEDLVLPVPWFSGSSSFKDFSNASQQQWRGPVSWRTAMSFDATQAFIQALSDNATPSTVLANLHQVNLSSRNTSGQGFRFTDAGERKSESVLVQVVRGSYNKVPNSEFGFELLRD